MKNVRITPIRKACCPDLVEKYQNPIEYICHIEGGQVWISRSWAKPDGFCVGSVRRRRRSGFWWICIMNQRKKCGVKHFLRPIKRHCKGALIAKLYISD